MLSLGMKIAAKLHSKLKIISTTPEHFYFQVVFPLATKFCKLTFVSLLFTSCTPL